MHALITGTNRGIGAALNTALTQEGWTVTGTTRDDGASHHLDVTDPASHAALAARLGDQAVDLLVCNAGVYLDRGAPLEGGFAAPLWADTFAVNVAGVFLTIQHLLPHLRRSQQPKIAIISSQMGSNTRAKGGSYIYRASKAAATNLGRNLALDLKPEGIAVGMYHPGWVITDMGGREADITVEQAAGGLVQEFARLSCETTGTFRTWDGQDIPF